MASHEHHEIQPFPKPIPDNIEPIQNLREFLVKERYAIDDRLRRKLKYDVSLNDFELLTALGSGSFGTVVLAKHIKSGNHYAIKVLIKRQVIKSKQIEHTWNEKVILESLNFPFVVQMECFFQDNSYLYFTMPLIVGGELFTHLRRLGKFDENLARFYGAQVLLGLEYLHYLDFAYRDLKPENLLVDEKGYIKIADLGFCKQVKGRTWTLCGTPEYLAPEIIISKGYGKSVDWWSYGVLLFEMCAGYPPFYAKDHLKLYEKIVHGKFKVASHFSSDLVDILNNILQVDLSKRYGNLKNGVNDIKDHRWFKLVEWLDLLNYRITPPYLPQVSDLTDLSNFDTTNEDNINLRVSLKDHYAREFAEF